MAYGNSYTSGGTPIVTGKISGSAGGSVGKEFKIDTGAQISGVDRANVAALIKAGATVTPTGGAGSGAGSGAMPVVTGITMTLPVFDPATGLTTDKSCSLPVVVTAKSCLFGVDQMKQTGSIIPTGGYIPGHDWDPGTGKFGGGMVNDP